MIRTIQTSEWLREGVMDAGEGRREGSRVGAPPAESSAFYTGLALSAHAVASMGADHERQRLTGTSAIGASDGAAISRLRRRARRWLEDRPAVHDPLHLLAAALLGFLQQ